MTIGPFRLGMRTLKSALSVMLCILLFHFLHRGSPMIAALSAVFSLRQDLTSSLSFGKSRVLGNTVGGALAILYVFTKNMFSQEFFAELVLLPLFVIIVIVFSDGIRNNTGIIAAISTLLMISLSMPQGQSVYYALERVIDTFIGTFIAILLNLFFQPKNVEKTHQIDNDLAELERKEQELIALRQRIQQQKNTQ